MLVEQQAVFHIPELDKIVADRFSFAFDTNQYWHTIPAPI